MLSVKRLIKPGIIICGGIACIWIVINAFKGHDRPAVPEISYPIYRQIRYSFTLKNTTNRLLKQAEFWTYGPVKQTATQRCVNLESSHAYQLIEDALGNQILRFTLADLPPYASKIITIKADLKLSDIPNPLPVENLKRFLKAEKFLEFDDPNMTRFAHRFKEQEPVRTAESIFFGVAGHIKYTGYVAGDLGALFALKRKQGDCTEFMYLFAALCRAHGIPARGMGGYICIENKILKPNDYHNWAAFYLDGVWRMADPQKKVFMKTPSHYIAMRVIGTSPENPMGEYHRFRFSGKGLKVRMDG